MIGVDVYNACKENDLKKLIELVDRSKNDEFQLPFDFLPNDSEEYEVSYI